MDDTPLKRTDSEVAIARKEAVKETAEMASKKEKDEYNAHKKKAVRNPEIKKHTDVENNSENKKGESKTRHDGKDLPKKATSIKHGAKSKTKKCDDEIITRDPKEHQKRTVAERKKRMELDDRLMAQELACQQYFVDPVMTLEYPPMRNRRVRVSNGTRELLQNKQNYFTIVKLMTFTGVPFFVINCVAGIEQSAFWWLCHGFLNALINLSIVATITLALQRNMLKLQKFSFFMCCISIGTSLLAVVISSIGMSLDRIQIITGIECNDPYIVIKGFACRNYTDPVTHTLEYEAVRVGYNSKQSMNLALVVLGLAQIMLNIGAILTGRTFIFDLDDDNSDLEE
ncbi:unnamed protein product [Owenia fusiformis]|uniref:Uncharacterized protein n=1 Tax=Owenia fusiformis TaxID=6347 RepID=A0A8J1TFT9_OWEFU|nr:unnamed protein product [Owenia fusiformis]